MCQREGILILLGQRRTAVESRLGGLEVAAFQGTGAQVREYLRQGMGQPWGQPGEDIEILL